MFELLLHYLLLLTVTNTTTGSCFSAYFFIVTVAVTNTWLQLASLQLNVHTNNNNTVSTQHKLECSSRSRGPRLSGGLAGGHCVGPHSVPASGGSGAGLDSLPTSGLAGASHASTSGPCWVGPPGALTSFSRWAGRTLPRPPALVEQLPRTPQPPGLSITWIQSSVRSCSTSLLPYCSFCMAVSSATIWAIAFSAGPALGLLSAVPRSWVLAPL